MSFALSIIVIASGEASRYMITAWRRIHRNSNEVCATRITWLSVGLASI